MNPRPPPKNLDVYLVGQLSRREYSRAALARKLRERGVELEPATAALDKMAALGLQSDTRYAEMRARSMMNSGKGPAAVRFELRRQGVAETDWPVSLTEEEPEAEHARAREWVRRRYGPGPWDDKVRRRAWGALIRRGFTGDAIQVAMRPASRDEDDAS